MLRAAAMLEPAHQGLILRHHLHAVDTEIEIVLTRVARSLGDDKRPGDEGRGLVWPAGLHGQTLEIDVAPSEHDFLALRRRYGLRPHRHRGARERQKFEGFAEAARRIGLAQ